MIRDWYSAKELAGLPGMPGTERAIQYRGKMKNWRNRPRNGRGGGREYHVSSLPEETRLHLAALAISEGKGLAGKIGSTLARREAEEKEKARIAGEKQLAMYAALPREQREIADARLTVLKARDVYIKTAGFASVKKGTRSYCERLNRGDIALPDEIRSIVKVVSPSTLFRWQRLYNESGPAALANHYHNPRRGTTTLTGQHQDFAISMLVTHPHCTVQTISDGMQARFNGQTPHIAAIRRFVNRWKIEHKSLYLYMRNPDEWKSTHMFAFGQADEQVERLNQLWEFDSTPTDVMLVDGRHALIGVIDVYTRRFKLLVAKTSRSTAVAGLVRRSILDWGVPEAAKTDNGADYVSRHLVGVFEALKIEQVLCPPFTPEAKPHIERAFRTFSHGIVELLPGYVGHSVADRKAIEARRSFADRLMDRDSEPVEVNMTAEQFQVLCDRWCEAIYHQNPHHGLDGKTPAEVARAWQGTERRITDQRALDVLLAEAPQGDGLRRITKKGVQIDRRHYIADTLAGLEGQTVRVKLDPTDFGTVYLFREDGKFLCTAVDPLRLGHDRAEIAARSKALQKQIVQAGSRELRKLAKTTAVATIHHEILEHREARIANIIDMPKPAEEYTTPALEEAARVVEAIEADRRADREMDEIALDSAALTAPAGEVKLERPKEKVVLIYTDSDKYGQIRDSARKLGYITRANAEWLGEYYQSRGGRMYMQLEGDLRRKYRILADEQAEQ